MNVVGFDVDRGKYINQRVKLGIGFQTLRIIVFSRVVVDLAHHS